ncbi:MAG: long-chain fatty acid--CoA ligase, partial [Alistipes sp.]|nr:long-chain fatty acid--CoA ligase [Alistipes sp.]
WLYTGDMGYMAPDGFLYVLGRFKSLLISSDGEKYSPEGMEEAMVDKSPYIDQIMIHNNQNPYTIAIIVPNAEALKRATANAEDKAAQAADILLAEIEKYRSGGEFGEEFPDRWLPAALAIVDEPFSEKNGLVNSTMKVVRNKVEAFYKERIEYCYTAEGKKLHNERNTASIEKVLQ